MTTDTVTVCDGKYTVVNDNGKLTALRYGEPWDRDLTGDNLVYWLFVELRNARAEREELLVTLFEIVNCFDLSDRSDHIDYDVWLHACKLARRLS